MCWCSLIDFARISNKLIRTMMIIVLSLSNLESGISSYVPTDNFKDLKEDYSLIKYRTLVRNITNENLKSAISSKFAKQSDILVYRKPEYHPQGHLSKYQISAADIDESNGKHKRSAYTHSNVDSWKDIQKKKPFTTHKLANIDETYRPMNIGHSDVESNFNESMYFGTENSTTVTTQIGATALIPCTVHEIGEGVVSWIRKKDYHLLTVGLTTYSSDERFSANHLKHSEQDWTLQIKFVQLRDAGIYECQISTHPPTSIFLHLVVVEARAEISGPSIRYLTPGSTLRLQCLIVQNTETSEYIFWYHDNRMINYDGDLGINVSTDPDFQSSELVISTTRREHSGNYTCVASNTQPASVLVHIFKGDNPAAMYHGDVGSSTLSYQTKLLNIVVAVSYRIYVKQKFCLQPWIVH